MSVSQCTPQDDRKVRILNHAKSTLVGREATIVAHELSASGHWVQLRVASDDPLCSRALWFRASEVEPVADNERTTDA